MTSIPGACAPGIMLWTGSAGGPRPRPVARAQGNAQLGCLGLWPCVLSIFASFCSFPTVSPQVIEIAKPQGPRSREGPGLLQAGTGCPGALPHAPPRPSCSSGSLRTNPWERPGPLQAAPWQETSVGPSLPSQKSSRCPAQRSPEAQNQASDVGPPPPARQSLLGCPSRAPSALPPPPTPPSQMPEDFVRVPPANITPTLAQRV